MSESVWHVTVAGQAQGPFTLEEVVARLGHDLGPDTLVWNPNLSGWVAASTVPEFAARLQPARPAAAAPPPRPAPAPPAAAANPYRSPRPSALVGDDSTLNPFKLVGRAFKWRGKFNRGEFAMLWLGVAFLNGLFLGLVFLAASLVGKGIGGPSGAMTAVVLFGIVCAIDLIAAIFVNIGAIVRRLNDLGKPGWWIVGAFVPLLGAVLVLYLLFAPGDPDAQIPDSFKGVWLALAGAFVALLLLSAVFFLFFAAAVAVPSLSRARTSANETSARSDLRTVLSAEFTYSMANGNVYEGRLECLREPQRGCIPGYTGPAFLTGPIGEAPAHGYQIRLIAGSPVSSASGSPSSVNSFAVVAWPTEPGTTGTRAFCIDTRGLLCSATAGTTPEDLVTKDGGDIVCSSTCSPS